MAHLLTILCGGGGIYSARFSPDGKKIFGYVDRPIAFTQVWDADTGKELHQLKGDYGDLSPNGKKVVTGSSGADADYAAYIWDAESGMQLRKLEGHLAQVTMAVFSPDGKRIATGSRWGKRDSSLRIWDAESGKEIQKMESSEGGGVFSATFSPNGKQIVTAGILPYEAGKFFSVSLDREVPFIRHEQVIRVFDIESGEKLHTFNVLRNIEYVLCRFSPDGKKLAIGSCVFDGDNTTKERAVRILDADSGKELHKWGMGTSKSSFVCSPDGNKIALVKHGCVQILDVESGKELQKLELEWEKPGTWSSQFCVCAFSPDGKKIALGGTSSYTVIWVLE